MGYTEVRTHLRVYNRKGYPPQGVQLIGTVGRRIYHCYLLLGEAGRVYYTLLFSPRGGWEGGLSLLFSPRGGWEGGLSRFILLGEARGGGLYLFYTPRRVLRVWFIPCFILPGGFLRWFIPWFIPFQEGPEVGYTLAYTLPGEP